MFNTVSFVRTFLNTFMFSYNANLQLVGDYINTIKMPFEFKFDLYQAVKTAWIHITIDVKRFL